MNIKRLKYTLVVLILVALILGGISMQTMASSDKLVFGMLVKFVGTPYINAFIQGAQEKADELGVKLNIIDGKGDSLKILEIIDLFVVQKVDGFIMAGALDLKAIVPGIKKINEVDIPVIALDSCPEGGKIDMFISFDIEQSSAKAAEAFVQGIKNRNGGKVPEGAVIRILGDISDMSFTLAVSKGFKSVMDKYPQLTIAEGEGKWNNIDSHDRTADLLTRFKRKVLGIYVDTPDIMGVGAVSAIEAAGLDPKDYGICGICIGPEGKELIKQDKVLAIVEQPALISGELSVQYLYNMNTGADIPKIGETVVEEGALWSPAKVVKNPWSDEGAFMILQGPLVPLEVSPDDPRLWENQLK
jgi:ribose transport system substrate-binding protein